MLMAASVRDLSEQKRTMIFEQFQDQIVEKISLVIESHPSNQNTALLDIDGLVSVWPIRMNPELTLEQRAVIEELFVTYDYGAKLVPDGKTFVPVGLQKEDGSGPEYRRYMIEIGW